MTPTQKAGPTADQAKEAYERVVDAVSHGGRPNPRDVEAARRGSVITAAELDKSVQPFASVVDLFCGAGGLSHGFLLEGFQVAAGVDLDGDCRFPFEQNNEARFIQGDLASLRGSQVSGLFRSGLPRVLVGCAPCQPFSAYNQNSNDPQWKLLAEFGRIVSETRPHVVSMENVPRLTKFRGGRVFHAFLDTLRNAGYWFPFPPRIAFAPDYGVPQRRSRLVLLASRLGEIDLEPPTHASHSYPTVKDAIGQLPALKAGEVHTDDPLHRCSRLSSLNLARIRAAKAGGSWRDWDNSLVADCHKAATGRTFGSVYGRMEWEHPAPTITTQFYGFGNGRFGHPEQDRALSLREGSILQSFPPWYRFTAPGDNIRFKTLGRLIGNAVPVALARAIARSVRLHLVEYAA